MSRQNLSGHSRIVAFGRDPASLRRLICLLAVLVTIAPSAAAVAQMAPPSAQPARQSVADFVEEASQRFGIPIVWILAVMRAESAGDTRATSTAGAMGLMQIMPRTWLELRARYRLGDDPYDSHDNIIAGTAYLRELYDRYGSPGFLAAYNAGPGRYEDHLATGRALPAETRAYLSNLAPQVGGAPSGGSVIARPDPDAWTRSPIFVARSNDASLVASADDGLLSSNQPSPLTGLAPERPMEPRNSLFAARGPETPR